MARATSEAIRQRNMTVELAALKSRVIELEGRQLTRLPTFRNLVKNGDGSTTVGFAVVNGTLGVSAGTFDLDFTASAHGFFTDDIPVSHGRTYSFEFEAKRGTISQLSYSVRDQTAGADIVSPTSYSVGASVLEAQKFTFVAPGGCQAVRLYPARDGGAAGTAEFDNIQLWEADPADDTPWLRLPRGRYVGKRGLILRDGMALMADDYTEILAPDGTNFIKPITPPGATTEFEVFAAGGAV